MADLPLVVQFASRLVSDIFFRVGELGNNIKLLILFMQIEFELEKVLRVLIFLLIFTLLQAVDFNHLKNLVIVILFLTSFTVKVTWYMCLEAQVFKREPPHLCILNYFIVI